MWVKLPVMEFVVGLLVDLLIGCVPKLLWEFGYYEGFLDLPFLRSWEQ